MRRFIAVVSLAVLASCGGGASSDSAESTIDSAVETSNAVDGTDTTDTSVTGDSIVWESCGDNLECGRLTVPLDYADPNGESIRIFLTRHLALDPDARIGSLLVNPGGPGFGGSWLAESAADIYSSSILDAFDVVGFDPRGTGKSEPAIDCVDDYDRWFTGGDITPDTPEEKQEIIDDSRAFTEECFARNGDFIEYVGTNNVARDMDTIRRALGEEKISYFGFSYGSELGAVWATLFPDTVRAAVLDGASDPNADSIEGLLQQNKGFEDALNRYLDDCSADSTCSFHNDGRAAEAFDSFMADLDENPIPSETGRPDLDRGMALIAVAQAMYDEALWPTLSDGLQEAATEGTGTTLLSLFDMYFQRQPDGTWTNDLEAFLNILCADDPERPTVEEADQYVDQYIAGAPRTSPGTTGNYTCTFWPPALDPRVDITGDGAGPVLVIGTTGDPATPLEGTRNMARALDDGRLAVATANQHIGYNTSLCINDLVDEYLVDLVAPDEEVTCA